MDVLEYLNVQTDGHDWESCTECGAELQQVGDMLRCKACDNGDSENMYGEHDNAYDDNMQVVEGIQQRQLLCQTVEHDTYTKPVGNVIIQNSVSSDDGFAPIPATDPTLVVATEAQVGKEGNGECPCPASSGGQPLQRTKRVSVVETRGGKARAQTPASCISFSTPESGKIRREEQSKIDMMAILNYCRFYGLPTGSATIEQVRDSSNGVDGWRAYDGPGLHTYYEMPATMSKSEQKERRRLKKEVKDRLTYLMTEDGQDELLEMIEAQSRSPPTSASPTTTSGF